MKTNTLLTLLILSIATAASASVVYFTNDVTGEINAYYNHDRPRLKSIGDLADEVNRRRDIKLPSDYTNTITIGTNEWQVVQRTNVAARWVVETNITTELEKIK